MASFEGILETIQSTKKKSMEGQFSMFDLGSNKEEDNLQEIKYTYIKKEEFSERELLSQEKEMLGIYLSGHPLSKLEEEIKKQTTINSKDIALIDNKNEIENSEEIENIELNGDFDISKANRFKDGQEVKFAGIITSIKKKFTKNNKIMAFVTIEDLYGQVEVLVFENAYLSAKESLIEENIILIDGRLSIREEEKTIIIANKISNFGIQKRKVLNLNITNLNEETKSKLRGAIKYFCGEMNNIMVQVQSKDSFLPCGAIYCNDEIVEIFEDIIGKENVCIKEV